MPLPDPQRSRVVLIGTAEYRDLPGLPAVAANLKQLKSLLTVPDLWGLPPDHCLELLNPENPVEVLSAIHESAKAATDTLVVYYAGHGLRDPDNDELFLGVVGSAKDRLFASVRYEDVRREIVQTASRVPSKVVLLDCCYSGAAMRGGMSADDSVDIADRARIEGTYLMTASAPTKSALAPEGERYTAFTGEIVEVFERGIPDGPDLLNMEKLYWHIRSELEAKRRPVPQQRADNSGGMIALVRNRRGAGDGRSQPTVPPKLLPEVPRGFEGVLRSSPREVIFQLDHLHEIGRADVAAQLLAAIATRRPAQEVAGLLGLLRAYERPADIVEVVNALAKGQAENVVVFIRTLREVDQPGEIGELLTAAACGPVQDVAVLAQRLRDEGLSEEAEHLLRVALGERLAADSMIALVGALWAAGLGSELERMLVSTTFDLGGDEKMTLAAALSSSGRAELAMTLYMQVLDLVVEQTDDVVASMLRTAREAGCLQDADRLIGAVLGTKSTADEYVELAGVLWVVGLGGDAEQVLDQAATRLGDAELALVAARLRSMDRPDAVLRLYMRASEHRPGSRLVGYVDDLRRLGRPVDGNQLFAVTASWEPPTVVALVAELMRHGRQVDVDRVTAAQADRHVNAFANVVDGLQLLNLRDLAERLVDQKVGRSSASEAASLAVALSRTGWAGRVVAALVMDIPQGIEAFAAEVSKIGDSHRAALLAYVSFLPTHSVFAVAEQLRQRGLGGAAFSIIKGMPFDAMGGLFPPVGMSRFAYDMELFLEAKANISAGELVRQLMSQRTLGHESWVEFLLDEIARRRTAKEIPALIKALDEKWGQFATDRALRAIVDKRTPEDFAMIVEALLDFDFGRRDWCASLLDLAVDKPAPDVAAMVEALRDEGLPREANQLVKRSKRRGLL